MSQFPDNERFRKLLYAYPAKAIAFLYEFYYSDLLRISVRFTRDKTVSEDIVQETFCHVWKQHELLSKNHAQPIVHYLIRVVQNKSISFYKKETRNIHALEDYRRALLTQQTDMSQEDRLIAGEIHMYLKNLLLNFPRREQECYRFSREEDMTNKQIAARLQISVKAVERSIASAKKRLKGHWVAFNGK